MAISFTQALLVFAVVQVPLYFIMLLAADREGGTPAPDVPRRAGLGAIASIADKASFALSAAGLSLTLLADFRESVPYFVILSLALIMNALRIAVRGPSGLALASLILWHLVMYSGKAPAIDVAIGEGSEMVREMRLNDHWQFRWAHNPSYNPLPTVAFLQATLSRLTGANWYSYWLGQAVFLAILVAYDLAVYALAYAVTRDSRASLLSIPLVAVTPETPIHQHPYQWGGNALVLIATALFLRAAGGEGARVNLLAAAILFTGAILTHPTALSFPLLLASFLLMQQLVRATRLLRGKMLAARHEVRTLIKLAAIIIIVALVRSLLTPGYIEYIYPAVHNVLSGLAELAGKMLSPPSSPGETGGTVHVPLYERAGVPWIQAYAWSYALAVATAYMLHALIRGRASLAELVLYATSAFFILAAYIGYGLIKLTQFYWLNRTVYVFMPLVYPLAAKALVRILDGLKRARPGCHLLVALLGLALLAAVAPVAAQDPNISPIQYAKIREAPQVKIDATLFLKASILVELSKSSNVETLWIYSKDIFVKKIVYTSAGLRTEYSYSSPIIEAAELYSFLNRERVPRLRALTCTCNTDRVIDLGSGEHVSIQTCPCT
ncbi:MAG: hypothetical protein LM577_04485 [Thermoproteaceae archaeon]|nr:hypothetical protein [Thermoproteaceae archaeon]